EIFKGYRELWRLEREWDAKASTPSTRAQDAQPAKAPKAAKAKTQDNPFGHFDKAGNYVFEATKAAEASATAQPTPVARAKPRTQVKAQPAPGLTMAEMLRAYGHVGAPA